MEKRHINRKRHLAAAVAAMALTGLTYNANASLTLQVDAENPASPGTVAPGAGKSIALTGLTPITLDVYATVSGTDGSSLNDALQSVDLSFGSTGAILGNMAPAAPSSPFGALGSQPGVTFGTAGDLDLGSTDSSQAPGWWIARSGSPTANATGTFLLGKITFTPTNLGAGTSTNLQLTLRNNTDGALWFEDATTTAGTGTSPPVIWTNDKNAVSGTTVIGAPVILTATVGPLTSEWIHTSDSNWNASGNWSAGIPGAQGDTANFLATGDASGARTVTLDVNETVGAVTFAPTGTGYTISGAHTLTMNKTAAGDVTITNNSGNNTISSSVVLSKNLTVAGTGGSVTLSNLNNSAGRTISKSGASTLTLTGIQNHGVGANLAVTAGTANINSDPGNNLSVNVTSNGTVQFGHGVAQYTVKSLNVDETANARVLVPGGAAFQSELVGIQPTPGTDITRSLIESVGVDLEYGMLVNTAGITTSHPGFNPAVNAINMTPAGDTLFLFETIIGDSNGDSVTNGADIGVALQYQDKPASAFGFGLYTPMDGDWNGDFSIDGADIGVMLSFQDQTFNPADGAPFGGVSAVPEPASLGLLGVGAVGLLRRRRRS